MSAAADRTPAALVHSNRALQLLALLRTAQPKQSGEPHWQEKTQSVPALPEEVPSFLPVQATALCTHAPMRRNVLPTALRGRLPLLPLRRSQRSAAEQVRP